MTADLFLSQAEVDALCAPLRQPAAQVRYLRDVLKLSVATKPNGRPVVVRSHAEAILSGAPLPSAASNPVEKQEVAAAPRPNVEGFLKLVKGGPHGSPQKIESA